MMMNNNHLQRRKRRKDVSLLIKTEDHMNDYIKHIREDLDCSRKI